MSGSPIVNKNVVFTLYKQLQTVFTFGQIALLTGEQNEHLLANKINYAVRTGKLLNPRKGIYSKPAYNKEEMACNIYVPVYLSLEYVLQKAGVLFQYDSSLTLVAYLSRTIEIENQLYRYRKIKYSVLSSTLGIIRQENNVNIANVERAFLDLIYLEKDYYFDNLKPLNRKKVEQLLPLYQSMALNARVNKLLKNG